MEVCFYNHHFNYWQDEPISSLLGGPIHKSINRELLWLWMMGSFAETDRAAGRIIHGRPLPLFG